MCILNFGSLNIDHVYQLAHIVAPGETISSPALRHTSGGKGLNQSIALAKAGAQVYHAGCVGTDGKMLMEQLREARVDTTHTQILDMVTGHAIIQVDKGGQNSIIIHSGANGALTEQMVDTTLSHFEKDTWVLMQNETSSVPYIARRCREQGLTLAFNPSPYNEKLDTFPYEAVTYLLINETEGRQISGETSPEKITGALLARYPNMKIVLTLGDDGVYYADREMRARQDAFHVDAIDTTGAGDTFTGFFLAMVMDGQPVEKALRCACAAAALSVTKSGAAASIPTMDEVNSFLANL